MSVTQPGQWRDVTVGSVMLDPRGDAWLVIAERGHWFRVRNQRGEERSLPPQPPDLPVTFIVPTLLEAEQLVSAELGGVVLGRLAALAVQPARASQQKAKAMPKRGTAKGLARAKAHLHIMHGEWANDAKDLADIIEHHDYLHSPDGARRLMTFPHHH